MRAQAVSKSGNTKSNITNNISAQVAHLNVKEHESGENVVIECS